jgi:tetratricopeptide (TPR) repeat protein
MQMAASFDEQFERGCQARSKLEHAAARAAFEAALSAAVAPHERAFALNELADTYFVSEQNDRALDLMDQAIAACLPWPDQETPKDPRTAYALAQTWYDKAVVLIVMNRDKDALIVLDESLGRFLDGVTDNAPQGEQDRKVRLAVVNALRMKASVLANLERTGEALACCDDLIRRFGSIEDSKILLRVARAMFTRAGLLSQLGRQDKEIAGYDEMVARFGDSKDVDITETVLYALERKTRIYQEQEDLEIVIEVCDEIIRRYGEDTSWRTADSVARAMIRRAVALGKRGDHGKELADYDQAVLRYGDSPESLLRLHAAKALMFKAVTLNDADQSAAEMECYDEVLRRYAEDVDAEVRAVAADALIHKGMSLGAIAEDAAEDTGVREIEAEITCYDDVVARYGEEDSIHLKRAVAEAQLHKGETLLEAERAVEASACLDSLIAGYATINDRDIQEIVKEARDLKADI